MRRGFTILALAALLAPGAVLAAEESAKDAYAAGVAAHKAGDFGAAARSFARADALSPNDVALKAALDAAVKADDVLLGAELLERAKSRALGAAARASVDAATPKIAHRTGFVTVRCDACSAALDGKTVTLDVPNRTTLGQHTIDVSYQDGTKTSRTVTVVADDTTAVDARPPPPPTPPPLAPPTATPPTDPAPPPAQFVRDEPGRAKRHGLPPVVFWAGVGATAAFGVAGGVFGVLTALQHGKFVDQNCPNVGTADCVSMSHTGVVEMILADVFLGVSGALAITTVIVGAAATDWSKTPSVSVAPGPNGLSIAVSGRF